MIPANVISRKRDGHELTDDEIGQFIRGFHLSEIPDYQMSALAMAICCRGMTVDETVSLTRHMLATGERLEWTQPSRKVDKHSTGGLGDKVSLVLAPALACLGLQVPMISGRGLGITGGTLDKLEAIPGFDCDLTMREIQYQTERVGCVICGASEQLAPVDRKLYALRDVSGTVESIPLITASILSKKLAESLSSLVLDVKFGSGAFMPTEAQARELAKMLVHVGSQLGTHTTAILSDMNQPLGRMVGNTVEVHESVDLLRGGGPADARDLTIELGARLLVAENIASDLPDARQRLAAILDNGSAYECFEAMVAAQGGRLPACECAPEHWVKSSSDGYISKICGHTLGYAMIEMGGGRQLTGDSIDHSVGMEMQVRLGDEVNVGDPLVRLYAHECTEDFVTRIHGAFEVTPDPVKPPILITETLNTSSVGPM
ncbi:MAG: thymidine phosphorylase [Planctomycetaceae bacterium]|nr:thymidine phosphorylase [Planctomycetaceae bacterium]